MPVERSEFFVFGRNATGWTDAADVQVWSTVFRMFWYTLTRATNRGNEIEKKHVTIHVRWANGHGTLQTGQQPAATDDVMRDTCFFLFYQTFR